MFWDSSALVPLLVVQPQTDFICRLSVSARVIWWGSCTECISAMCRLKREGQIDEAVFDTLLTTLQQLADQSVEVQPTDPVRLRAERLLRIHPLRAADALQLAAALVFTGEHPFGFGFVCLDERLRQAARSEGFTIHP